MAPRGAHAILRDVCASGTQLCPMQVRELFQGLVFWKNGGAMFDFIFQQVEGCGTMTIADRARVYRSLAKSREASALRAYLRFVDEQREALLAGSTTRQQRTLVDCGFTPRTTRSRRGGTESTLTPPEFGKFPECKSIMAILCGIRRNETFEPYSSTTTRWWSLSCMPTSFAATPAEGLRPTRPSG